MEGWANVKKAAEYANVSERTLRDWLKEGLKHSRLNKKTIRVRYCDIDEFLEKFKVNSNFVDEMVNSVMLDFT